MTRPAEAAAQSPSPPRPATARWIVAVAAAATAFAVLLAPPVSGDKDASEFALVLATGGVAHPTGYPLYTLAGHAFVNAAHAAGSSFPFAANLWSALGAGVAAFLLGTLSVTLARGAAGNPRGGRAGLVIAVPATWILVLDPAWTAEATLAEVHSWHVAWACGAALHATGTLRRLAARDADDRTLLGRFAGWGLVCGLGLAHHATSVLVIVPLTLALTIAAVRAHRLRAMWPVVATGAAIVPLASYGWIAWRAFHPAGVQWPELIPGWDSVLAHVTGAQYRGYLGGFAPSEIQSALLRTSVLPVLVPGLAALVVATVRVRDAATRAALGGMLGVAGLGTAYALVYGVADPVAYFLVPMALGLAALAPLGTSFAPSGGARTAATAVVWGAMLVAAPAWVPVSIERRASLVAFDDAVRAMWRAIPADEGFVVWADDMSARLREYQTFDGERPRLVVLNPVALSGPGARARFAASHGFDPLASARSVPRDAASITRAVQEGLRRGTRLPVYLFDPVRGTLAELPVPPAGDRSPR